MPIKSDQFLTPPQIARLLRVGVDHVHTFIRSGELKAVNLSRSSRPRWKISPENFQRFLDARSNTQTLPKPRRNPPVKPSKKYV